MVALLMSVQFKLTQLLFCSVWSRPNILQHSLYHLYESNSNGLMMDLKFSINYIIIRTLSLIHFLWAEFHSLPGRCYLVGEESRRF